MQLLVLVIQYSSYRLLQLQLRLASCQLNRSTHCHINPIYDAEVIVDTSSVRCSIVLASKTVNQRALV